MTSHLRYPIDCISKDSFDALCISLIRDNISMSVMQVSAKGKDDKRDAIIIKNTIYGDTLDYIFQFKQYQSDLSNARSVSFRSFKKESEYILEHYNNVDCYIYITSVPFSGLPETGLLDKVLNYISSLKKKYHDIEIEFWDGLKMCSFIDKRPNIYEHFFKSNADYIYLPKIIDYEIDFLEQIIEKDSLFEDTLQLLFPLKGLILYPKSESPLWFLISTNRYSKLNQILTKLIPKIGDNKSIYYDWCALLLSYCHIKTKNIIYGLKLLNTLSCNNKTYEFCAWYFNCLSIAYGKIDKNKEAIEFANRAIYYCEKNDNFWLSSNIRLRIIHKESWNENEKGNGLKDEVFREKISGISPNHNLYPVEINHTVYAEKSAMEALHYSWSENTLSLAEPQIESALRIFDQFNFIEESARLKSEKGRIQLKWYRNFDKAIAFLKEAIKLRIQSDDIARVRYDLSWLGEAYLSLGNDEAAQICSELALKIQSIYYNGFTCDNKLIIRLKNILKTTNSKNIPISETDIELISYLTGLNSIWLKITIFTKE
jgi:hypothetical protein